MALDLNDHLLQAPDELLAPLLGHLPLEVALSTLTVLLGLLLVILVHVSGGLVLQVLCGNLSTGTRVGLSGALLLVQSSELSRSGRVTGAIRVGSLGAVASSLVNVLLADGHARLGLVAQVLLGKIGSLVPDVVLSGLINVGKLVLRRVDDVGRLLRGVAGNVAEEDAGIAQELAELAVGDEKCSEGTEALKSLVAVLLGSLLVNGGVGLLRIASTDLLSLPDEVLNEVALVLGEEQELGLLNDLLKVAGELLALGGEPLAGRCQALPVVGSVERDINLLVLQWVLVGGELGKQLLRDSTDRRNLAIGKSYVTC